MRREAGARFPSGVPSRAPPFWRSATRRLHPHGPPQGQFRNPDPQGAAGRRGRSRRSRGTASARSSCSVRARAPLACCPSPLDVTGDAGAKVAPGGRPRSSCHDQIAEAAARSENAGSMRIKVINPNTTASMTVVIEARGARRGFARHGDPGRVVPLGPGLDRRPLRRGRKCDRAPGGGPSRRAPRLRRLCDRVFRRPRASRGPRSGARPGARHCRGRDACGELRRDGVQRRDHARPYTGHRRTSPAQLRMEHHCRRVRSTELAVFGARGPRLGRPAGRSSTNAGVPSTRTGPAPSCSAAPAWRISLPT